MNTPNLVERLPALKRGSGNPTVKCGNARPAYSARFKLRKNPVGKKTPTHIEICRNTRRSWVPSSWQSTIGFGCMAKRREADI
jgi:hypothetical protein